MHRTARAKSDALIEKMIGCGKSLAHSECALFYWFDDSGRIGDWVASGLPQSFMDSYRNLSILSARMKCSGNEPPWRFFMT